MQHLTTLWIGTALLFTGIFTACGTPAGTDAEAKDAPLESPAVAVIFELASPEPGNTESPAPSEAPSAPTEVAELPVTLFVLDEAAEGLLRVSERVEGSPDGLLLALASHGVLTAVSEGEMRVLSLAFETESITDANNVTREGQVIYLDVSQAAGEALSAAGTAGEALTLTALVNTFLTFYDSDAVVLTIDGEPLDTGHRVYDAPICYDAFAKTAD